MAPDRRIQIPHQWSPRPYQRPLWNFLEAGGKRAVAIWHRRSGKDSVAVNWTATAAFQRVGTYFHMCPVMTQARKVIWDSIDSQGRRVVEQAFPEALRSNTHENEMRIKLKNGSIWQAVGSDNYDQLVGTNPVGLVFSEYALADPQAWQLLRPIIAENGGWALFISTPRGSNHLEEMYNSAKSSPEWFTQIQTVEDTKALDPVTLEGERREMSEALFKQEYYCSFYGTVEGSYYAKQFELIELEKRLTNVPWEPLLEVNTAWDLGLDDQTSIWFFQRLPQEVRIIDYYEASGAGLDHYVRHLRSKPYTYRDHLLPHDVQVRELGSGRSRKEMLESLGVRVTVVPKVGIGDGIAAARSVLSSCWFDKDKCEKGIKALKSYKTDFDTKTQTFKQTPKHDWTSHAADAFRYLAVGLKRVDGKAGWGRLPVQQQAIMGSRGRLSRGRR